jgi:hypothetical protein
LSIVIAFGQDLAHFYCLISVDCEDVRRDQLSIAELENYRLEKTLFRIMTISRDYGALLEEFGSLRDA